MLVSVWLVAVACGAAVAAPQDFNFEKSVVVRSDVQDGGHRVETTHTEVVKSAPPPPVVHTQVVHKSHHTIDREAHDRFWRSESGQALDNAGSQLFSALGEGATALGNFFSNLFGRSRSLVVVEQRDHHAPQDRESVAFLKTKRVD